MAMSSETVAVSSEPCPHACTSASHVMRERGVHVDGQIRVYEFA